MVDQTVRIYGRLDCAHNNAGIATPGQTHEIALDAWDRVLAVNLTGVFLCLKHEIAQLPAQGGGGAIVNTASIAGLIGGVNSAYVASNHGVVGLTKNAALEYAQQGIRVNAVYPGVIPTPLVERAFAGTPGLEERWLASEPIGRFGRPDEVARQWCGSARMRCHLSQEWRCRWMAAGSPNKCNTACFMERSPHTPWPRLPSVFTGSLLCRTRTCECVRKAGTGQLRLRMADSCTLGRRMMH
jgi:NAD(P)-dependent dehydrogenase (short-subunit alcohol dehydrogenase family)